MGTLMIWRTKRICLAKPRRGSKRKSFKMRTRIACGWLVGHSDNRHNLWRNAELVYEDSSVIFVGEKLKATSTGKSTLRHASSSPASSTRTSIRATEPRIG